MLSRASLPPAYGATHSPGPGPLANRSDLEAWIARADARREPPRPAVQPDEGAARYLDLLEWRRATGPDRMSRAAADATGRAHYGHDPVAAADFQAATGF